MSIDITKYVNSYEFDYTLPGSNEVVVFKPITTGQLKKLIVYENENDMSIIEDVLDNLMSSCVISEGFDINKLYLEDRFALLVEIRKKSKGEEYNFIYTCPKCGIQGPKSINLNDLEVKKRVIIDNKFKVSDDLSFDISHITRGEQKLILGLIKSKDIKNLSLKNVEIASYTYAMSMRTFHTPEGDTDDISINDKVGLLDNVFTDDQYKEYIQWFTDNKFGVEFNFPLECECEYKGKLNIPLNNFFA